MGRLAAHADEATQHADDGTFYIQHIEENDPGYAPGSIRYATLDEAQQAAARLNDLRGLTAEDVREIRMSSMFAGPVQR